MADLDDDYEPIDHPAEVPRGGRPIASALEKRERHGFIRRLAVLHEHVRRLADQLRAAGIEPCLEPPAPVVADDNAAALAHLTTELSIASGRAAMLQEILAERGVDWRAVLEQRAKEVRT